jgi:hypothetical protein
MTPRSEGAGEGEGEGDWRRVGVDREAKRDIMLAMSVLEYRSTLLILPIHD